MVAVVVAAVAAAAAAVACYRDLGPVLEAYQVQCIHLGGVEEEVGVVHYYCHCYFLEALGAFLDLVGLVVLVVLMVLGVQGVQADLVYPQCEGCGGHQCQGVQCVAVEAAAESV